MSDPTPPPDPIAAALARIARALELLALAQAVAAEVRLDELAESHLITAGAAMTGRQQLQGVIRRLSGDGQPSPPPGPAPQRNQAPPRRGNG